MLGKSAKSSTDKQQQPPVVGEVITEVNLLSVDELADHPNIINATIGNRGLTGVTGTIKCGSCGSLKYGSSFEKQLIE